jgi:hypothetical protein
MSSLRLHQPSATRQLKDITMSMLFEHLLNAIFIVVISEIIIYQFHKQTNTSCLRDWSYVIQTGIFVLALYIGRSPGCLADVLMESLRK